MGVHQVHSSTDFNKGDVVDGNGTIALLVKGPNSEQAFVTSVILGLSTFQVLLYTEPADHGPLFTGSTLLEIDPEDFPGFAQLVKQVDGLGQSRHDEPLNGTTFAPKFEPFRTEQPGDDVLTIKHHFEIPPWY